MVSVESAPKLGDVVAGKYILLERIGEGGMGLVYLAEQPSLARKVVIKLLQPALAACDAVVRQFHTEAIAACRVQDPGAVSVIDCGKTAWGMPYIAMEYVPGRLLSALIDEEEISPARALQIVRQLLRTLKAAHGNGVIHADIKSDNVIVGRTADGRADAITLIDFGLARIEDRVGGGAATARTRDSVSGTPEYMAPELVCGELPTPSSDLYGAGVVLYELLTGRTPFESESTDEILTRQLQEAPVPPSQRRPDRAIPAALDRIVLRALEKDPQARFGTADDFAAAVTAALREMAALRAATVATAAPAATAAPPRRAPDAPLPRAA